MKVKYRTWFKGIPPTPIKLDIPGWAGSNRKHEDGVEAQPWHCPPFVEGSTYGLELIYPFQTETHVVNDNGTIRFEANWDKEECVWADTPSPPFSCFAKNHYGFTSSLDISVPDGHVIRLEPHPRFFTDTTDTCPIAVPGHIHPWWCKIFFVVFKSPRPGQVHVFRQGEPYAQILVVPNKASYEIEEMNNEEKRQREATEANINKLKNLLPKKVWRDNLGNQFDDKYKQLLSVYSKSGQDGVDVLLAELNQKHHQLVASTQEKSKVKRIGRYVKK